MVHQKEEHEVKGSARRLKGVAALCVTVASLSVCAFECSDTFVAITEGGEASSVLGMLEATLARLRAGK